MTDSTASSSGLASATPKPQIPQDISSILQQVQTLQSEREKLQRELESTKSTMSKLQEGKREEMRQIFENVIQKWLADSVKDEEVRKQFQEGCHRMAENANDCGVWTVAVQASNLHRQQVEELERLRVERDALKQASTGSFREEGSRKRPSSDGPSAAATAPGARDFWGEMATTSYE